jgi:hypothetical protein
MDHFVKLDKLPEGFEFPPQLKDRIHFDPAARKLVFRGYMSKTEFDRICEPTRDWSFRRSVEELFLKSVKEVESGRDGKNRVFGLFGKLMARN